MKTKKFINPIEIKFIKENEWLADFFDKQINIKNLENFINHLGCYFLMIISIKSNSDNKNKIIVDWLQKNFPENYKNEQIYLNDNNTELANLSSEFECGLSLMDYEQKFTKVVIHLFEQSQEKIKYRNFEFPKSIKIMDFCYDKKLINHRCYKLHDIFYDCKEIQYYYIKSYTQTDKTIESV